MSWDLKSIADEDWKKEKKERKKEWKKENKKEKENGQK